MSTNLKLEKFEGPLDLLLQLIEGEELDITEISLSQVTEQYLKHLDKLEKNRSVKLADFLVIAAKLIYLKSKNLLPYLYPEEETEGPSLADQLKMYKSYVDASKNIESKWQNDKLSYGRIEKPIKIKEFTVPINAGAEELHKNFQLLIKRLKPIKPLPQATIDHSVSIKQTVDKIRDLLKGAKRFSFKNLFSKSKNKTEVIVGFLALLDLLKKKDIMVRQGNSFSDLEVNKI
jgi:segregation and condensation protein A